MSIEHNGKDVDCRHQKIKVTKLRQVLGKQNFQTLHPFQKNTANKSSYILRRPQKSSERKIVPIFCGILRKAEL